MKSLSSVKNPLRLRAFVAEKYGHEDAKALRKYLFAYDIYLPRIAAEGRRMKSLSSVKNSLRLRAFVAEKNIATKT